MPKSLLFWLTNLETKCSLSRPLWTFALTTIGILHWALFMAGSTMFKGKLLARGEQGRLWLLVCWPPHKRVIRLQGSKTSRVAWLYRLFCSSANPPLDPVAEVPFRIPRITNTTETHFTNTASATYSSGNLTWLWKNTNSE